MIEFIYLLILSNVVLAALALHFWLKLKRQKARPDSRELQEFLHDLMMGNGLVRVQRINPADILLRSPNR